MATKLPELAVILSIITLGQRFSGYENHPLGYLLAIIGVIAGIAWIYSVFNRLANKESVPKQHAGKIRTGATWTAALIFIGFVVYPWIFQSSAVVAQKAPEPNNTESKPLLVLNPQSEEKPIQASLPPSLQARPVIKTPIKTPQAPTDNAAQGNPISGKTPALPNAAAVDCPPAVLVANGNNNDFHIHTNNPCIVRIDRGNGNAVKANEPMEDMQATPVQSLKGVSNAGITEKALDISHKIRGAYDLYWSDLRANRYHENQRIDDEKDRALKIYQENTVDAKLLRQQICYLLGRGIPRDPDYDLINVTGIPRVVDDLESLARSLYVK